ncbi:MAG: hypothetical protein JWP82_3082, partial [Humibacillus sp.]|nr:hypothetical protein [Humibacillus sp.]
MEAIPSSTPERSPRPSRRALLVTGAASVAAFA